MAEIYRRGSADFDQLREKLIWNARLQSSRAPDAIVRPRSADEVAAVVRLAGKSGARIALRGSGHNYQGAALRNEGLMIDIGALERVEIDAVARRAWVGAGVKGGHLIEELAQRGLAFPIGHCSDVALSGYILSGGIGWNYGEWGPACANVTAMEIVTAAGEIVVASPDTYPDLFWAAKGAGCAFFAAVTAYELVLHELPATSFALDATFEASGAATIAQWLNQAGAAAHPTVELICLVGPDPETHQPSITARAVTSAGSIEGARNKLGPLLELPPAPLLRPAEYKSLSFAELTRFSSMPSGKRVAADQIWSEHAVGDLLPAIAHLAAGPQASSAISLTALAGGAATPGMPNGIDGALSVGGSTSAGIYALWDGADNDRLHLDWVAAADAALAPFRSARYVGEADLFATPGRVEECFSSEAFAQLRALRQYYDPEERFFSCLQ